MYVVGPYARRKALDLKAPLKVARKVMRLGLNTHADGVEVPIGCQLPLKVIEAAFTDSNGVFRINRVANLYQQGYLVQGEGEPWEPPPSDAELAAAATAREAAEAAEAARMAKISAKAPAGRR